MNARACGLCKHLDSRPLRAGGHWCWFWYRRQDVADVVKDCTAAERADGTEPPGRIRFAGERT